MTFDPKAFWDKNAQEFVREGSRHAYGNHHAVLFRWLEELNPTRVLLVGVGFGRELMKLVPRYPEVHGADVSPSMLALARERVPAVIYTEADIRELPFPKDFFDVAISFACLTHVPPETVDGGITEVFRVGKIGILVEGYSVEHGTCDSPFGEWNCDETNTWLYDYVAHVRRCGLIVDRHEVATAPEQGDSACILVQGHRL